MRFRTKLAMASAAAALMAGAASAQTTITLSDTMGGDISAGVALSNTANLVSQTGTFEFDITPADMNFGTTAGVAGLVTVNLENAAFQATPAIAGSATTPCATAAGGATISSGGNIDDTSVTFQVPDIADCGGGSDGILIVTMTIGLIDLADSNFDVTVRRGGGVVLAPTVAFETMAGDPLVQVLPPFEVAFSDDEPPADMAADRTLALGLEPPFSAFDAMGTDFTATLGQLEITAPGQFLDLQGTTPVGPPNAVDITITAANANGIDRFEVGAAPDTLDLVAGTNQFSGMLATPVTGMFDIAVFLSGDVDPAEAASVAAQNFTPSATVTLGTGADAVEFESTGSIAGLLRQGQTRSFSWVPLESGANVNRVFRITGLNPASPQRVLATVSGLNTNETPTPDVNIVGNLNVSGGGEAVITGTQLGGILQGLGEIDRSAPGITRGDVSITIEADGVDVKTQLITANGGVSAGANLDQ